MNPSDPIPTEEEMLDLLHDLLIQSEFEPDKN